MVSDAYIYEKDEIWVSMDEPKHRRIFIVARQIYHRNIHKEWSCSSEYQVLLRADVMASGENIFHQEASKFALKLKRVDNSNLTH